MDFHSKTCLVIDLGLFTCVAEKLAEDFGKVYYHSPWTEAFPRSSSMLLGSGLKGVERCDYWEEAVEKSDLIVFPDAMLGPLQVLLEGAGKRVWGGRMAEELELYRDSAKKHMKSLGINVGPYEVVVGVDRLREYLKEHENVVFKMSFTRGDMESVPRAGKKSKNYPLVKDFIDDMESRMGPRAKHAEFIIEEMIPDAVEIAYDGYTVDGTYPDTVMWGVEVKSRCYVGHCVPYAEMPSQIVETNARIGPTLGKYQCRSWAGMEMRVTKDGRPWVIDPLIRFGNPPGALCTLMYGNLAEIMWYGAEGQLVEPELKDEWGAQILIHSDWSARHWQAVYYPEEISRNVRLVNHTVMDDVHYVVPGPDLNNAIGSIVATGPTMQKAIEKAQEYAEQVEGYDLDIEKDSLPKAEEEFKKLAEYHIVEGGK